MKLFKRKHPIKQELKPEIDVENLIGIASLKETVRFLEYQKSLSVAFHEGQTQEVQHLLENKIEGNLSSLQRNGEGWLIRIWNVEDDFQ